MMLATLACSFDIDTPVDATLIQSNSKLSDCLMRISRRSPKLKDQIANCMLSPPVTPYPTFAPVSNSIDCLRMISGASRCL